MQQNNDIRIIRLARRVLGLTENVLNTAPDLMAIAPSGDYWQSSEHPLQPLVDKEEATLKAVSQEIRQCLEPTVLATQPLYSASALEYLGRQLRVYFDATSRLSGDQLYEEWLTANHALRSQIAHLLNDIEQAERKMLSKS